MSTDVQRDVRSNELRAWRRAQAQEWAEHNDVQFVTTRNKSKGVRTLHRFSCTVVQRLMGGEDSSVIKADRELFLRLLTMGGARLCPTCHPEERA